MHSMLSDDGNKSNKAKGVNTATEFNEFRDTLLNKSIIRHKMKRIQSKKHKLGTYEINKISLSCFDDKRFVLDDGVHMLAYFHKDFLTNKNNCARTKIGSSKEKEILTDEMTFHRVLEGSTHQQCSI